MENLKFKAFKNDQMIEMGHFHVNLEENIIFLNYNNQTKVLNLLIESKFKLDPFSITFYCGEIYYILEFNKHDPEEKDLLSKVIICIRKIQSRREKEFQSNEKAKKYIIKEPKNFQKEILQFAKDNNTIVFLETGLGKTFIAIMLLKDIFGEPLESNFSNRIPYQKKSNKKALFLCKTIGLLIQQAKVLKYNTNLKIFKIYGGADKITTPSYSKFRKNIGKYNVIVGSAESVYRYYTLGYFHREEFNLVVFDECHHCKKDDFYNILLKHFIFQAQEPPRILGLTASPSDDQNYEENKLNSNIQKLSNNMNSYLYVPKNLLDDQIVKVDKKFIFEEYEQNNQISDIYLTIFNEFICPLILDYSKHVEPDFFKEKNCEFLYISSIFLMGSSDSKELQTEKFNWIFSKQDYQTLFDAFKNKSSYYFVEERYETFCKLFLEDDNNYNFYSQYYSFLKNLFRNDFYEKILKIAKFTSLILRYVNGNSVLQMISTMIADIKSSNIKNNLFVSSLNYLLSRILENKALIEYKSNALNHLLKCLGEINNDSENKTLIFTKYRVTAFYINQILNTIKDNSSTLILGYNSNNFMSFSEKELNLNLEKFRDTSSKCNILVCTDVAEEGLDIQQCNHVIHLDKIETIKSYIQKNGRGRKQNSVIHLFISKNQRKDYEIQLMNIEKGISIINEIVKKDQIKPFPEIEVYRKNFDYFETNKGAKIYLNYAKKLLTEFLGRLEFDGYNWLKEDFKIEYKKDGKIYTLSKKDKDDLKNQPILFRPYLYLGTMLEKINKVYDTEEFFNSFEEAMKYKDLYSDHYYLKAIKILYHYHYLNDNLIFSKHNDDLIHMDSYQVKIPAEPIFKIKQTLSNDDFTYYCHVFDVNPKFIDINLDSSLFPDKLTGFISNFNSCNNFDLFIRNSELSKLYFYNKTQSDMNEENPYFHEKPKLPYTFYNIININFSHNPVILKFSQNEKDLIDFFHSYLYFFISDAECIFYYSIFLNNFSFSSLFKDQQKYLKKIFEIKTISELFDLDSLNSTVELSHDSIKFIPLKKVGDNYLLYIEYLNYILDGVKNDIIYYYKFLSKLTVKNQDYTQSELDDISNDFIDNETKPFEINNVYRNLINFTKCFSFPYSTVNVKGTYIKKGFNNTFHDYYKDRFGLITKKDKDYIKTKLIDFNSKIFKYRVNLTTRREIKYKQAKLIKRFNYLPFEILYRVEYFSIDELFYLTLIPIIAYKIQNNIKYFYYTKSLYDEYKFINNNKINLSLIIEAVNSKTTLEALNYERLEFLGDSVLKFLSSWEVFKQFKIGNKDLLSMKRKLIENNENLFEKAYKKNLYKYLITSQFSFKRIREESKFNFLNVQNNRVFSKYLLKNRSIIPKNYKESLNPTEFINNSTKTQTYEELYDTLIDDKFAFNTDNELQEDPIYQPVKEHFTLSEIRKISNSVDLKETDKERILYKKNLADLVESLVGYIYITNSNSNEGLEEASSFLKKLEILEDCFDLSESSEFWLDKLDNTSCLYSDEEKIKRFSEVSIIHPFRNRLLLYQAFHHPTYLTPEAISSNYNYVNSSYHRLSFLGEALISMIVSKWVYTKNPGVEITENTLHKLKICGINHHIISLMSIDLAFDSCIYAWNIELKEDLKRYKEKISEKRQNWESPKRIKKEDYSDLDIEFTVILCEVFYSFWGAVLLDTKNLPITIDKFRKVCEEYLLENATLENYTEHPKVEILELFFNRRIFFKEIKENGYNRLKFTKNAFKDKKKNRIYNYQLIIDNLIIFEDDVVCNRGAITKVQTEALKLFREICKELDERIKLSLQEKYLDLEQILVYLGIPYRKAE